MRLDPNIDKDIDPNFYVTYNRNFYMGKLTLLRLGFNLLEFSDAKVQNTLLS